MGETTTKKTQGTEVIPVGHERVLFVDDEEVLTQIGRAMLQKLGYEVTVKTDATEALALFRADPGRFDLVITDQTMPDLTGVELFKRLHSIRDDVRVILTTGYSDLVDASSAKTGGIGAFVMKPFTKGELARAIRKVLDG